MTPVAEFITKAGLPSTRGTAIKGYKLNNNNYNK